MLWEIRMKTFKEARGDTAVFTFGRFNPPTTGHEKLIDALAREQGKNPGAPMYVYPSHSQNPKKDPLPHNKKVAYMKKMFSKYKKNIKVSRARNVFDIAVELHNKGHKAIVMVVGSDRVDEFDNLLNKYNGEEGRHGFYGFDDIKVVSAGERDPDADGVEGMSASKMRAAAVKNQYKNVVDARGKVTEYGFESGLPKGFTDGEKLFADVRKFMNLKEEFNLTMEELNRDLYIRGEIWNVGDVVKTTDGDEGTIIRKGTNYVVFEDLRKVWLHNLEEVKQDKDIKDREGTQPAKYFAKDADGDEMSVSTKKARARHFAKGKSGPAPGDADADTKPSKHTKKFKQMYGETENPCWDTHKQVGMKKKNGKMVPNCVPKEEVIIEAEMKCPPATQDLKINTKNRDATIKNFNYGPLNVDEPGDYWKDIAKYWKTTEEAAKKSLCGNCVAFDISPRMDECMPGETSDDDGRLGYCWMHHFKCHSARSCHTWAKGGPIKTDEKSYDWQERANMNERKLTDGEKDKLKDYEKDISKKDFIDRYGKEEGESIYYATLTKMAKQHAEEMHEMSIGKIVRDKIYNMTHPKKMDSLVKAYADAVAADTKKRHGNSFHAGEVIRRSNAERQGVDVRQLMSYINSLVKKGTIPATLKAQDEIDEEILDEKIAALVKKAEKSGMPYGILKKVYDRGMAAYKTGHRPGATPQQWALARVNSFTTKSKGTWGKADADLAAKVRGETYEIGKDYADHTRKVTPGQSVTKESIDEWFLDESVRDKYVVRYGDEWLSKLTKTYHAMLEKVEPCCDDCADHFDHIVEQAEYQGKKVKLNDPIRTSENPNKKFKVYVKNEKGKVVVVRFGDPNMAINRDDPKRRKSFRARHNCDDPGPKTKARYWSCFQWRAGAKVDN
jgi:DNA-binding MarR family transcriptional regulator